MKIYIDTEHKGFAKDAFRLGCIIREDTPEKARFFHSSPEMWNYIERLAKREGKRNRNLFVYAHFMKFDFWRILPKEFDMKRLRFHSPTIIGMTTEGKENTRFLDTMQIYGGPLHQIGELIDMPKIDMPKEIKSDMEINPIETPELYLQMKEYLERDTRILQKLLEKISTINEEEGIEIRKIYTINQIAGNYICKELRERAPYMFDEPEENRIIQIPENDFILEAYRGGRVEAFKTGTFEHTFQADCNSLYPYAAMKMPFPDIRTCTEENTYHRGRIGILRCVMLNKTNKTGILPIRTPVGNYYPREESLLYGTWTTWEIQEAMENGYELLDIEKGIYFREIENPFKEIIPSLYEKRFKSPFHNYYFKSIMNRAFGKLAQHRYGSEIIIDLIEEAEKYFDNHYDAIGKVKDNYLYRKKGEQLRKPYFCPIIPTLINAYARIYMNRIYANNEDNILYTDTDSIITEHGAVIPIGTRIGEFKTVHTDKKAVIYGRKTYMCGDTIHISGMSNTMTTPQDFIEGKAYGTKMMDIRDTQDIERLGEITQKEENLKDRQVEHDTAKEILKKRRIYIDSNIEDIMRIVPYIHLIRET